jgi:hypothetical protein
MGQPRTAPNDTVQRLAIDILASDFAKEPIEFLGRVQGNPRGVELGNQNKPFKIKGIQLVC